jgi:hypothetical protein
VRPDGRTDGGPGERLWIRLRDARGTTEKATEGTGGYQKEKKTESKRSEKKKGKGDALEGEQERLASTPNYDSSATADRI